VSHDARCRIEAPRRRKKKKRTTAQYKGSGVPRGKTGEKEAAKPIGKIEQKKIEKKGNLGKKKKKN